MWELDHKENWALKNWCFWAVLLEKTLESHLDYKEIKSVHPKGNQSWIFIGRTDAEAETPILWPSDVNNRLIWKDPDAGKDWKQEEKGMTEGGWIASLTQWMWVWVRSGSWWWTGKPGMLQSMGSQRVGHDWAIELNGPGGSGSILCSWGGPGRGGVSHGPRLFLSLLWTLHCPESSSQTGLRSHL